MATISKDDFLSGLRVSKLIDEEYLQEKLIEFNSDSPREIAAAFVKEDLLTEWQARSLLSGRSRLHIGNYRLLERIRHNELGDRFFAIHDQLHRLVEIQLFPANLYKDKKATDLFLEVAGRAATIDHPNLMHVYDIDQEGGRFYLVFEYSTGDTLESIETDELSTVDIAMIVKQVLQGLEAAHQKNIVHGDIRADNLLVTDQDQVKILNLAIVPLVNQERSNASPTADLRAIGKLGNRLLAPIDSLAQQPKQELAAILKSIETTDSNDLDEQKLELDRWITQNDERQNTVIPGSRAVDSQPSKSYDSVAGTKPKQPNATNKAINKTSISPADSFIQRHSIAILATTAALCLMVLGGTAWMTWSGSGGSQDEKAVSRGVLDEPKKPASEKPPLEPVKKLEKDRVAKLSPIKNDREFEFENRPKKKIDMAAALADSKARLQAGRIGGNAVPPAVEKPSTPPDSASSTAAVPPQSSAAPVPETKMESKPDPAAKPAAENLVVAETEFSEEQLANPFKDMPRAVDLGEITQTTANPLGKVYIGPNTLMACELISGRAIAKQKYMFELERSATEQQRWFVNFRKRKSSPSQKIGSFFRKDDTFNFQWEPNASEHDSFNYIRNCVLKITGQNQAIQFVNLRTALPINGLFISAEQGMAQIESEINWIPNPNSLVIEVDLPSYQGVPKMYPFPSTRRLEKNQPVNLLFNEPSKNNFIYLQLSAEYRKELRLQLALIFDQGNGNTQPVDKKGLTKIIDELSRFSETAVAESAEINNAQRPFDVKAADFDKEKKQLKTVATEAISRKAAALKYQEFIPKLYNKQIPLRVYFKLDNHNIIIAESSEN